MKTKQGQVTIFIIIAVLLILVTLTLLLLFNTKPKIEISELNSLLNQIQICLEESVEQGIYYLGMQGGYYKTPQPSKNFLIFDIPFYLEDSLENIPPKSRIELELNNYVLDNLEECLGNFETFKNQGFEISKGNLASGEVNIGEGVSYNLNYPLIIRKNNSVSKVEDFYYFLDFDFISKHNIALEIITAQKNNPKNFPIGTISALSYEHDFIFENFDLEEDEIVVSLIFKEFDKRGYPFIYSFGIKYGN